MKIESGKDGMDNSKDNNMDKENNNSNLIPNNEKEQPGSHIKSNISNLQNSAFKNFKSELRSEPANMFL